ncbi:hypothetical protein MJ581_00815 [Escherichia coli]|nr:hypothetical protein MJ581_00815 [Escherichia coli]
MKDLKDGVIRLIGNPETRATVNPVRMLRAVRFAAKWVCVSVRKPQNRSPHASLPC